MNTFFIKLILVLAFCMLQDKELSAQPVYIGSNGFRVGFVRVKIQSQEEVKLVAGNIEPLYKLKRVCIRYDRDSSKVCDYDSETAYFEHRCKEKDSVTCRSVKEKWIRTHKEVCEPNFEDYFNRNANKLGITGINNSDERIPVLMVRLRMEEPHYHTGGWSSPPYIVMECSFYNEMAQELAVFELKAIGSPKGDNEERLRDCYAIAGKLLSKELYKRMN